MLFEKARKHTKSLAFRLTLWYAGVSTVSLLIILAVSYLVLYSTLTTRMEETLRNEVQEDTTLLATQGLAALKEDIDREALSEGSDTIFLRILDEQGAPIASTDMTVWKNVPVARAFFARALGGEPVFQSLARKPEHPSARVIYGRVGPGVVLQMGLSRVEDNRVLENFREFFGSAVIVIGIAALLAGWFMAQRALAGVGSVTLAAGRIANGDFSSRVPVRGRDDEIDVLAKTFNLMIERIQRLLSSMTEITDDIAHDLRSPITRVRGTAEMALTLTSSPEQQQGMIASIIEDCDSLLGLINTMLEISETEAGVSHFAEENIDFAALLKDVGELFQPAAEDKGVTLQVLAGAPATLRGDRRKLSRVIGHIIDNAVKYTEKDGLVRVTWEIHDNAITTVVSDTGIGISKQDQPHIFDRFYRADQSRSHPGNGLGLSLARAIIKACGGNITVESEAGKGSAFRITLPCR